MSGLARLRFRGGVATQVGVCCLRCLCLGDGVATQVGVFNPCCLVGVHVTLSKPKNLNLLKICDCTHVRSYIRSSPTSKKFNAL